MFKKDDKVKVVKGIKAFEDLTGTVLDTNGNQVKVKLNLSNDSELQKNLINVFEAYQLELESLDLLKEDNVSFDNDVKEETDPVELVRKRIFEPRGIIEVEDEEYLEQTDDDGYKYENIVHYISEEDFKKLFNEFSTLEGNKKLEQLLPEVADGYNREIFFELDRGTYVLGKPAISFYNMYLGGADEKDDFTNESLKLTESELKAWCSDNDANYYTQDIKDDKVIIRGLNEDLGEYNFKTKELKVFDYSGTTVDENELDEVEDDDNYIRDYVYDIDMLDEKTEIPSWEFASIIATAEDTTEDAVITEAHDRGFKVYLITASNYEKLVVASEKITEEDIMDDFAAYLEGSPKVTEVI